MHPFLEHPSPIVFAHRGCHESGPENSFDAFQGAFDKGVRYMETDVHLTLDGHLVAFHDRSLLRMTGAPGLIRDLTLADVVATPLTHGARIPTLLELLEALPNAKFNIDLKSDETVEPFIKLAKANPILDRVCVGSFSDARTDAAKSALPGLCTSLGPKAMRRAVVSVYTGIPFKTSAQCAQIPVRFGPINLATKRLIEKLSSRGLHIHYWTINSIDTMGQLIDIGAHGVMTDFPSRLIELLAAQSLWHE